MAFRAGGLHLYRNLLSGAIASISRRPLSTAETRGGRGEFHGKSAYEVLGVSPTSSFEEIKASFRRLAKETHPDICPAAGEAASPQRFIQILAAYEILSDSNKRAHYDNHLFSQRKILQRQPGLDFATYSYNSSLTIMRQSEVVEWLEWYRLTIKDIVTQKIVASGSGYLYELESELYSAIRAAYYGPIIESMDVLPDCFEAEERSASETSEVLHLVSGRDLLGMVYLVDKVPELTHMQCEKIAASKSMAFEQSQSTRKTIKGMSSLFSGNGNTHDIRVEKHINCVTDVYKDLELHISGRVVATATRSPPKCKHNGCLPVDSEDFIHVFLNVEDQVGSGVVSTDFITSCSLRSRVLLGTIIGLGTSAEEGSCSVYDKNGAKTHMIMKHRTLLVKHMHWYQVGDEVSICECRCSRARLPPSKFWLFEPRSSMHDIGGWYIETFGWDKNGKTIPSQRQWDCVVEHSEKRLHPAMYLLALAYRTLDLEEAKRRKLTVRSFVEPKLNSILRWCKNLTG